MAEHGVAALSHIPPRRRVRTRSADPSGAWDQDHPPQRATTTQESGLRENRTSRLSERTEEGRKPDLLRLYRSRPAPVAADFDPRSGSLSPSSEAGLRHNPREAQSLPAWRTSCSPPGNLTRSALKTPE